MEGLGRWELEELYFQVTVFLLEFLLEEKKDARLKGSKVNGLKD